MVSTRFLNAAGLLIVCLSLAACEDSDVRLGREALEGGEPDKALNFFSIAAERNRTDANVRTLIGQVHLRKGNLREAAQWFGEAQRLGYSGATLGKSLSDEARLAAVRDPQKALSLYAMAVQYDPAQAKPIAQVIASTADQMVAATPILALPLYEAAVKYDATVAPAVAKKISEAAADKLESDTGSALLMYRTAVKYDSGFAASASERISQAALTKLDSDASSGLRMMAVAVEYNPALKKGLGGLLAKSAIAALGADSSRAASLTKTAIDYDPGLAPVIANGALERAKGLGADPKNWGEITRLARFAKPLKGADAAAWGKLLFENVSQADTALVTSDELVSIARVVVEFDNTKRSPLSDLFVQVGTAAIAQESLDLESAAELFNAATGFDAGKKAAVSNAVWTHFSRRLLALPIQLTKEQFGRFVQIANGFGVPAQYANTVAPYAQALQQYTDGNRAQAINTFSQIAQSRPASREGKAAIAMLAPPSPTTMKFNAQPFHFNTYLYGAGGGRGVDIQFISAEITQTGVNLTFSVKTPDHPDMLLFSRNNRNGGPVGDNCELVYLLDDNGTKIYSTSGGFQGGRQASFNDCDQVINLNVGEEAIVTASFPMISRGATTVKFVSPDPDRAGHQAEWWVGNIQLKKGPFDDAAAASKTAAPPQRSPAATDGRQMPLGGNYGSLVFEGTYSQTVKDAANVYNVKNMAIRFVPNAMVNPADAVTLKLIQLVASKKVADKFTILYSRSLPISVPELDSSTRQATITNIEFQVPTSIVDDATHVGLSVSDGRMMWPVATEFKRSQ
jgi:tetratricopeptide (TPR) repeat protein